MITQFDSGFLFGAVTVWLIGKLQYWKRVRDHEAAIERGIQERFEKRQGVGSGV